MRYDYDVFDKITAVKNGSNQTITDTASIAFLNPLRYRGYVYDDETGLYYLQSRYYDPVTGRFLNADVYADTGSGSPLSTNMFAYCENNYLYRVDKNGQNAAWIQASHSVGIAGHTSLLIQDSRKGWWYFYWGNTSVQMLFLGEGVKLERLNNIIERILIMYSRYWWLSFDDADSYDSTTYFYGDFSSSVDYILSYMNSRSAYQYLMRFNPYTPNYDYIWYYYYPFRLVYDKNHTMWRGRTRPCSHVINYYGTNPYYNLAKNNCMQMSVRALLHGRFSKDNDYYNKVLSILSGISTPNIAHHLIKFFKRMSDNNNAWWGYQIIKLANDKINNKQIRNLRDLIAFISKYYY